MRVLVVYAHPNRASFCHAVLEKVTGGLRDGGHSYDVIDLHAIGFDPVFRNRDYNQFMHESLPDELVEQSDLKSALLARAGGPRPAGGRRAVDAGQDQPRDRGGARQADAAGRAEAPGEGGSRRRASSSSRRSTGWACPAILKGWFERVFAYGFAYTLDRDGWNGHLEGRVPLLTQQKGLLITPTFFTQEEYERGWQHAVDTVICDWGLKMAGVKEAEHVYLYAVSAVDQATRLGYLDLAYRLGRDFARSRDPVAPITPERVE